MRRPSPPQSNPRQRVVEALIAQSDWCSAPELAAAVIPVLGITPEASLALVLQVLMTLDENGLLLCETDLDTTPLKLVDRSPVKPGTVRVQRERPMSDRPMQRLRYQLNPRGRSALARTSPTT